MAFEKRLFGRTGRDVGPLGLGSSYGLGAAGVERAFERGVRFFLWGSRRRPRFADGLRALAPRHRGETVIAVQTYTRAAWLMEGSLDRALRALGTDYVDHLVLSWWNAPPPERIVDAACRLQAKGKAKHLMISCHDRPTFARIVKDSRYDALMVRYNAAHPGAEREVFPHLAASGERGRPGVVAFTATRWGTLLDPARTPAGERTPRASDCYRFALTSPHVDVCLAGPKDDAELDVALTAVERGPLSADEDAWMRRVGASVRNDTAKPRQASILDAIDKLASLCAPKQLGQ